MRAIRWRSTVAHLTVKCLICAAPIAVVTAPLAWAQPGSRKAPSDIAVQSRTALASDSPTSTTDGGRAVRDSIARSDSAKGKRQTGSSKPLVRRPENVVSPMKAQSAGATVDSSAFGSVIGTGQPPSTDQRMLMEFQQEMMAVAGKASNGDVASRARLAAWQAIVVRHQSEIAAASHASTAGSKRAAQRLQQLEMKIIREWIHGGAPRPPAADP